MSGATPIPETAADRAVSWAEGAGAFAKVVGTLKTTDPALAAQQTGSPWTYARAIAVPVVGMLVGRGVAYAGFACTSALTQNCWSPDTTLVVTNALVGLGCAGSAALLHWWSKAPARAALAAGKGVP